jgi:hypothetical protein
MNDPTRSYVRMTHDDLRRLGRLARDDREEFFARNPKYRPLRDYVLAVRSLSGWGLHYVNGTNGIKDLDVWTFCAEHPTIKYPDRRPITPRDFGDPKFGSIWDVRDAYDEWSAWNRWSDALRPIRILSAKRTEFVERVEHSMNSTGIPLKST